MTERISLFELSTQDPVELNSFILKSKLISVINSAIREKNLNQKSAAELLKTTQPRMSNLKNAAMSKFSVDFLLACLIKLGYSMDFDFDPTNVSSPMQINIQIKEDAAHA